MRVLIQWGLLAVALHCKRLNRQLDFLLTAPLGALWSWLAVCQGASWLVSRLGRHVQRHVESVCALSAGAREPRTRGLASCRSSVPAYNCMEAVPQWLTAAVLRPVSRLRAPPSSFVGADDVSFIDCSIVIHQSIVVDLWQRALPGGQFVI